MSRPSPLALASRARPPAAGVEPVEPVVFRHRGVARDAAPRPPQRSRMEALSVGLAVVFSFALLAGCTPSIGDKCTLSTDCSIKGDRQCDTAQPSGYCTIFNCGSNSCPDDNICVAFQVAVPGCLYNDRAVARTGRSLCMKPCTKDSNCRDGYDCRDPRGLPWSAKVLDDFQSHKVCIPADRPATMSVPDAGPDPAVCQSLEIDASIPPPLFTPEDASAAEDAPSDATSTGGEGGAEAGSDAAPVGDAGVADATLDGAFAGDAGDGGH